MRVAHLKKDKQGLALSKDNCIQNFWYALLHNGVTQWLNQKSSLTLDPRVDYLSAVRELHLGTSRSKRYLR
jgi:hypothetical protein